MEMTDELGGGGREFGRRLSDSSRKLEGGVVGGRDWLDVQQTPPLTSEELRL